MGAGADLTSKSRKKGLCYQLRPADFSDWAGLHRLLTVCFSYMDGRVDPSSSLRSMTPDDPRRKAAEESLIVVFDGDELVACGFLTEADDSIYLGKLAVSSRFRRRGILRAMVEIAEDMANRQGRNWLELQTRIELTENHRTFEAHGFARVRETAHPGFAKPTSVTMRKRVFDGRTRP